jgi:hypothetical protein
LLPRPAIHADLAPLAAFPAADEDGTARLIEIGLDQRERLADPQTGAPQHNDQAPEPETVGIITGSAHHGDDLLNGWRVWRVAQPLVARRTARVKARQCGRRSAPPRAVEQRYGLHDVTI